jgi:hypothetical protein
MTTRHLRTIKLGSISFLWRVDHHHHSPTHAGACAEVFSAFQSGFRKSALRIHFPDADHRGRGFPSQSGVIFDYRTPAWSINLHKPRTARLLIELALTHGWTPLTATQEHSILDGFQLLLDNPIALEPYIMPPPSPHQETSPG